MSLSKTWYSTANRALDDTSTAAKASSSALWALGATLTGNVSGTNGPEGARPSGAYWTLIASSNSLTAGIDATDRLHFSGSYTSTDWVQVTSTGVHTWYILQSPSGLLDGPWYLCIDYIGAQVENCAFIVSNTVFSGGTTSARPTATGESALTAQQFISTTASAGKTYFSTDANGGFRFYVSRNGTGYFSTAMGFEPWVETHSGDTARTVFWLSFVDSTPGAMGSQTNWNFRGKTQDNSAAVTTTFGIFDGTVRPAGTNINSLANTNSIDSTIDAIPMGYIMDTTTTHHGIRGRIPDLWLCGLQAAPGSTIPSTGSPERMICGSWMTVGSVAPSL